MPKNPYEIAHEELIQTATEFTDATQQALGSLGLEPDSFNMLTMSLKPEEEEAPFETRDHVIVSGGNFVTDNGRYRYGRTEITVTNNSNNHSDFTNVLYVPQAETADMSKGLFTLDAPLSDPLPHPDHILTTERPVTIRRRTLTTYDSATNDVAIRAGMHAKYIRVDNTVTHPAAALAPEVSAARRTTVPSSQDSNHDHAPNSRRRHAKNKTDYYALALMSKYFDSFPVTAII